MFRLDSEKKVNCGITHTFSVKVYRQMWHKPGNADAFKVDGVNSIDVTIPSNSMIVGYKNGEYYAYFLFVFWLYTWL